MPLVNLDSEITEEKMTVIGKVHSREVENAMLQNGVSHQKRRRVLNRLYNQVIHKKAIYLRADELPGRHFPKGSGISIPGYNSTVGNLDDAAWVDGALVVVVDSKIIAPLPHSTTVLVWPEEESKDEESPNQDHVGIEVSRTQGCVIRGNVVASGPWSRTADDVHARLEEYRGLEVELPSLGVRGVLTDAQVMDYTLIGVVLDGGRVYKVRSSERIFITRPKGCVARQLYSNTTCDREPGHRGPHLFRAGD